MHTYAHACTRAHNHIKNTSTFTRTHVVERKTYIYLHVHVTLHSSIFTSTHTCNFHSLPNTQKFACIHIHYASSLSHKQHILAQHLHTHLNFLKQVIVKYKHKFHTLHTHTHTLEFLTTTHVSK